MYYLVLTIHFLAALFLILVVLLQSGRSGDLATAFGGGGGSQAIFGPRAGGNVLTKATAIAASVFIITCLALVWLGQSQTGSRMKNVDPGAGAAPAVSTSPAETPAAPTPTPAEPAAPAAPGN